MAEASTRILLDRTVIRLDGRPFFSMGVRLLLTPWERIRETLDDVAAAGFTTVITPPASPGNLPIVHAILEEASYRNLMVIVSADRRVPEPSSFIARQFRHFESLHSYCLPLFDQSRQSFERFIVERDRVRAQDLFHPIWTPFQPGLPMRNYLECTDLHSVAQTVGGPFPRDGKNDGARLLKQLRSESQRCNLTGRPFFCSSLQVSVPEEARAAGFYEMDPLIRRLSPRVEDWYPYLANLPEMSQRDFLPPDPDLLRLRCYSLCSVGCRGILADSYDFLQGRSPYTGRDRFCELSVLAQEVLSCPLFFSEGRPASEEVETGHPRLRAGILQHSNDFLLLVWRSGQGDEYWIDPSPMHRVEVGLPSLEEPELEAWRVDFPRARRLNLERAPSGLLRLRLQSVDLTARVLLTSSAQRSAEVSAAIDEMLPTAAAYQVEGVEHRLNKVLLIERDLMRIGAGTRQERFVEECRQNLEHARALLDAEDFANAWDVSFECIGLLRRIINTQMIAARSGTRQLDTGSRLALLRHSYYTLPDYYKESAVHDERAIEEYT